MNFGSLGGRRSVSPTSSRASSPVPRIARQAAEDVLIKNDKSLRRYATTVERALGTWETAPEEWADYIAFLSRLLRAIQSHGKDASALPHSSDVASKLAQCLNPALPSGVHQKALEVYTYIFATFGREYVTDHLHAFLPGLSGVLSFASLSTRPGLYDLLENYIVRLDSVDLRPIMKSLVLSVLPALEDETSEDFEQALSILAKLESTFVQHDTDALSEDAGYFWQCLFLAVITSPSRRQGALNYLTRRLPNFAILKTSQKENGEGITDLSHAAEAALTPEAGLLIRCFVCGLSDPQPLIQRGFLDLLVTHLPLSSPVLQERVMKPDFDRLTTATISVLLRRDMSLNRRVWSWLLGPEAKEAGSVSPSVERNEALHSEESQQFRHFATYGQTSVQRCLMAMLEHPGLRPVEKARPFRICLSLMDRWEIGGPLVPRLFLPAMKSVHAYSTQATREEATEAIKSASLFFDGTESRLIWSELFKLLQNETEQSREALDNLHFFRWIVQNFNVREEEMLTLHIPLVTGYLLDCIASSSGMTVERLVALSDCATTLLELIPARAFVQPSSGQKQEVLEAAPSSFDIPRAAKHYYERWTGAGNSGLPSPVQLADLFVKTSLASLSKYMTSHPEVFAKIVQIVISLLAKIPKDRTLPVSELAASLCTNVESSAIQVMQYSTVSSAVSLLAALLAHQDGDYGTQEDIQSLEIALLGHLWHYLSPTQAKHHVEAVRLIWHLDDFAKAGNVVRAGINELMQKSSSGGSLSDIERVESICRFTTLWTHTLPLQPVGPKIEGRGVVRRGSSMITNDPESWSRRLEILSGPLLLCLDTLHDSRVATRSVVRNLMASPNSIGLVFQILFTKMTTLLNDEEIPVHPHEETSQRAYKQKSRELEYVLEHLLAVLTLDDEVMWQGLSEIKLAGTTGPNSADAVTWLATQSIRLVGNPSSSHALNEFAASILRRVLNGPYPIKLRVRSMSLEDPLLRKVRDSLALSDNTLQTSLLELTVLAMGLRQLHSQGPDADSSRRKLSLSNDRRSSTALREEQAVLQESGSNKPPSQLLDTLREGFASLSSRVQMDAWLDFLAASLPIFGDMLLTNLIPLVDTFCDQLRKSFSDLKALSDKTTDSTAYSPDTTILKLLEGLNMLLAEAHDRVAEEDPEPQRKASAGSQSVLGSMASSAFKSQAAPPSRSAKANSRLTVILAFQDAIRMCIQIWTWSAGSPENDISDRYNAATTSYYTYRMRNRTRSMLEQMFSVEPLESLEVVMTLWSQASNATTSNEVLSLLHVLPVSRPKSVVPAILDALCSRTHANHMSPSRQSSLTSDLSAADVVAFFTAYLETVEDDATDEIWPDCTAFMRDVLANPLPFRSILPALLWVTLILAEKLDNTNFGDQRKMRRELGDQFSRLLSATFAASPINSHLDANGYAVVNSSETDLATGRRNMDVVVILRHVVAKIESILDSVDRITTVVNTISTSVISPAFHARSFPSTVKPDILGLLARMTKKAPTAKSWRREVLDAFNNPRILDSAAPLMEQFWFPVLQQWSQGDKERVHDLLARLAPPSSAGIMFGVGAAAARLKADGETQFIIRRLCLLLLASPTDSYAVHMQLIGEKLVELFQASISSSPSATIKAELFMLCRALVLSTSPVNVAPLWPIINDQLQAALATLAPQDTRQIGFTNLSLLQAGKLLDLLVSLSPDEFQLYEWLYVTDTTDAVYHPPGWTPTALADQLAEHLGLEAGEDASLAATPTAPSSPTSQARRVFGANLAYDKEDIKAMAPEDFAKTIMRPFLSQLSINAYESTYGLEGPDPQLYRRSLLEDILDSNTLVDHER